MEKNEHSCCPPSSSVILVKIIFSFLFSFSVPAGGTWKVAFVEERKDPNVVSPAFQRLVCGCCEGQTTTFWKRVSDRTPSLEEARERQHNKGWIV